MSVNIELGILINYISDLLPIVRRVDDIFPEKKQIQIRKTHLLKNMFIQ